MKVHFLTIVLDGMPWLPAHLPVFNSLNTHQVDWHWHIVEGVAANVGCTRWCKRIPPRLSMDGTTEFLEQLSSHKRVSVYQKTLWEGKLEMVNTPLRNITEPGLLWEVDADEMWTAAQILECVRMFEIGTFMHLAQFKCRYFMGPDIVLTSENCYGNRFDIEWYRVWKWTPGQLFKTHEPPVLTGIPAYRGDIEQTARHGLVFDHYAYTTEEQVAFKEVYYGYPGAVKSWKRLQENNTWPANLRDFIPWVTDNAVVERIK